MTGTTMPVPVVARVERHAAGDAWPCYFCGRTIRRPLNAQSVEVVQGGNTIALPGTADTADRGYMGFFPVGPECIKRVPARFRS